MFAGGLRYPNQQFSVAAARLSMSMMFLAVAGLMIPVRCNNHPWMEAFLNVVKNPFFAVSDANGTFEIQGLPPGSYTLVAVHEKLGTQTQQIAIESHKTSVTNFTFIK